MSYDAWYETNLGRAAHAIERDLVRSLAEPTPGELALDVGCGTGVYSAWLAGLGLDVTGVDRDPDMLAIARAKAPGARFVEGDATALPFEDSVFDLAVAVTVFCFLDGAARRAAARELVRVVRPGGRVVLGELARYSLWAARRRLRGWRGDEGWRSARFSTAGELERLFRAAGAACMTVRYGLYVPPWDSAAVTRHAPAFERYSRRLGPLGAAFVAARFEAGTIRSSR